MRKKYIIDEVDLGLIFGPSYKEYNAFSVTRL